MKLLNVALIMDCLFAATAADLANMSGSWWLNPKRSRWEENKRPPNSVALEIQHNEPALKYSGTVNRAGEDAPTKFSFDGAIDGKQYTVKQDEGDRKVTFTRKSPRVVESVTLLPDGTQERSTMTLSHDGKTLERRMEVRDAKGKTQHWVEIYEKRQ